ncbi:unnamed protein product [Pocillopora meandrina]|uniref:Uncharacterized protein n=1 Tax=Pocillopora meandrina TaxID=46732 RepID=A0AAU9X8X0_9CNID|nr:unnamed protein product [Pocillopora meandrina]
MGAKFLSFVFFLLFLSPAMAYLGSYRFGKRNLVEKANAQDDFKQFCQLAEKLCHQKTESISVENRRKEGSHHLPTIEKKRTNDKNLLGPAVERR